MHVYVKVVGISYPFKDLNGCDYHSWNFGASNFISKISLDLTINSNNPSKKCRLKAMDD